MTRERDCFNGLSEGYPASFENLDSALNNEGLEPVQYRLARLIMERGVAFEVSVDDGDPFVVLDVVELINHQVDVETIVECGRYLAGKIGPLEPTKLVTVKSGGNSITQEVARQLGISHYIFANKGPSLVLPIEECYVATNRSYTQPGSIDLMVAKRCIDKGERLVFVDDFLDEGDTTLGVQEISDQAKSNLVGAFYLINKLSGGGETRLREMGWTAPIESVLTLTDLEEGRMKVEGVEGWLNVGVKADNPSNNPIT